MSADSKQYQRELEGCFAFTTDRGVHIFRKCSIPESQCLWWMQYAVVGSVQMEISNIQRSEEDKKGGSLPWVEAIAAQSTRRLQQHPGWPSAFR